MLDVSPKIMDHLPSNSKNGLMESIKEQRFKDYLGNHQVENQVWFTAYPQLTAVNIANNEAIHDGLQGRMNERQARAWLKRL